ncbi:MAG: hypothetical protein KUG70_11315 [Rhodobacteraceae bacterium]|nr:hypothetical protein [Paracoccaceae bacterium]
MVNNNKILTVSYGTFSCTLEGFDDSFSTMKAIAEYFRDLASDDRYFGAEPPQLDAEMMARIAQRQISSPVDAYEGESGIVLRANETDTVDKPTAPVAELAPVSDVTVADVTVAEVAAPEVAEEPVVENLIEDTVEEPVAVEIADIDEIKTPEPVPPTKMTAPAPAEIVAETDIAPTVTEDALSADDEPVDDELADDEPADDQAEDDQPVIATAEIEQMQDYVEPAIAQENDIAPAADSIAAKLQRIRAVVSRNEASAKGVDIPEDEDDNRFLASSSAAQSDEYEDEDLVAPIETARNSEFEESEADTIASALAELMVDDEDQEDVSDIEDDENNIDITNAFAALSSIEETETPDDKPDDKAVAYDPSEIEDDDIFSEEDDDIDGLDDLGNLLEDVRDTDNTAQTSGKGRVFKIKRTEFESTIVTGQNESDYESFESKETTLSFEDEADLLRELADVEAEETGQSERDANEHDAPDAASTQAANEAALESDFAYEDDTDLPPEVSNDEQDLSRLLQAADTKMDDPETTSRRETYSQLRAAVTVANAEQAAGSGVDSGADDGAYRKDLASVVRPRRPEAVDDEKTTKRPNRPISGKPAPLKLVAEQRVDDHAKQTPRGPIHPRRVAAVPVDEPFTGEGDGTGGFVKFAKDMEATDLKELLEAAAAYMSFVETREHFTRPQLMAKVRQVETNGFSREDGLRSFGKLLREGKIQKTGGGQFTASEDIGFRPDERAVG